MYVMEDVFSHERFDAVPPIDARPTIPRGARVMLIGEQYRDDADALFWQSILHRNKRYEIWPELLHPEPPAPLGDYLDVSTLMGGFRFPRGIFEFTENEEETV